MTLNYSGLLMLMSSILLGYFTFRRWREFRADSTLTINKFYFLGAGFVSLGLLSYALPVLFADYETSLLPVVVATSANMIGFSYFLRIPLYMKFSGRVYSILSHSLALYVVVIIGSLIIHSPIPNNVDGTIHWNFSHVQSTLILILNITAFTPNIFLIYRSLRQSDTFWLPKFLALMIAFTLTGFGSVYLYVGTNDILLRWAYFLLFAGIFILTIGTLFGPLKVEGTKEGKKEELQSTPDTI